MAQIGLVVGVWVCCFFQPKGKKLLITLNSSFWGDAGDPNSYREKLDCLSLGQKVRVAGLQSCVEEQLFAELGCETRGCGWRHRMAHCQPLLFAMPSPSDILRLCPVQSTNTPKPKAAAFAYEWPSLSLLTCKLVQTAP